MPAAEAPFFSGLGIGCEKGDAISEPTKNAEREREIVCEGENLLEAAIMCGAETEGG
jgi:hypothetical protein